MTRRYFLFALVSAALVWMISAARAQLTPELPQTGLNAAMMQLFGEIAGFTAQAEVRMLDNSGVEAMRLPLSMAMLARKVRAEIDMSAVKSKEMPPEAAASLKQIGLDKMVSIVRPDKKLTLVIYPSLRAYAEAPLTKEDAAELEQKYKIETAKVGNETLDGHACEKNKVTFTAENGKKQQAVVWNASDLQKFPLQIEMKQEDGTVVMRFSKVQLTKPEASAFEAPATFTKQASVAKMMQDAMLKALGK